MAIIRAVLATPTPESQIENRIASVAGGSPLVATIAAALVRDKAIRPELVPGESEFANEVFAKFQDALVGEIAPDASDKRLVRDLLPLIAAFAPVRDDDEALTNAFAAHLGVAGSTVRLQLGQLEGAGVLVRSGGAVRITPDVLADHILIRKSLTAAYEPSGYPEELATLFGVERIEPLLRNYVELDWRVRQKGAARGAGVDALWRMFEATFSTAAVPTRETMLGVLEAVAYFQPSQAVAFVRSLVLPEPSQLPNRIALPAVRVLTSCSVHRGTSRGMRDVIAATRNGFKRESGEAVSALVGARRPTSGTCTASLLFTKIVLDAVERWLAEHPSFLEAALKIAKPYLAKTGMSNTAADRRQFTMTTFAIPVGRTASMRARARSICARALASSNPTLSSTPRSTSFAKTSRLQ